MVPRSFWSLKKSDILIWYEAPALSAFFGLGRFYDFLPLSLPFTVLKPEEHSHLVKRSELSVFGQFVEESPHDPFAGKCGGIVRGGGVFLCRFHHSLSEL